MLATRIAATGTRVITMPEGRSIVRMTRALILAEQFGDAVERDRIDVPCVAGNVNDLVDDAVVWRMEAVIHAGRQPQRNVLAVAIELDELRVDQQILQRVGKSFGLDQLVPVDPSAGADNRIAGTGYDIAGRSRPDARRASAPA